MGVIFIFLAACGYATVALFGRWIFDHELPMYAVLTWRFAGAALIFHLWKFYSCRQPVPFKAKSACFLMGMFADALQTSLFFFSIAYVGASIAALLLYTFPLFVFLIQRFFFHEPASKIQWISLSLSLTGCLFIINPFQEISFSSDNFQGIWFGLATGLTYAFYLCFGAHFTKTIPPTASAAYLTSGAAISFFLITLTRGELLFPSLPSEWLLSFLIVLIATVIPLFFLVKGMQLLGATQTALLFTLEPIVTIIFAVLFFNESLVGTKIVGSLLILSSAVLIQKKKEPLSIPIVTQE